MFGPGVADGGRLPTPIQPAKRVSDSHRIQALPQDCGLRSDGSQSRYSVPLQAASAPRVLLSALPQTSPFQNPAAASSTHRIAKLERRAHCKTPPRFDAESKDAVLT